MSTKKDRISVVGSERVPMLGARSVGPSDPNERVEVTVRVRRRSNINIATLEQAATRLPHERQYMSHEEFEKTHGADPKDLEKVEEFAREYGLNVVETNIARRSVLLSGPVAALNAAFGVQLENYEYPQGKYRGRKGPVHVPAELEGIVEAVFGLDNRPQAKPHLRVYPHAAVQVSYTPPEIAQIYNFPNNMKGEGQCIAIIELGGGYRTDDLEKYFSSLGLPTPRVSSIPVDGGQNNPGDPTGSDGEVMLDIEVAGAIAPGAEIAVYFAPNTDQGFLDAITTAIHDTNYKPSVISISWGAPESRWTRQALKSFDQAFQTAALLGITVCCASGDNGSYDGVTDQNGNPDQLAHVDFPASSPYVLACGGTHLMASDQKITQEVVWNDTGGGISDFFDLPIWQRDAHVPPSVNSDKHVGRGVPDIAGDADPSTGYRVRIDGQDTIIGGTSAVAPLWAALIVLINQQLAHNVGYLNPLLYRRLATAGVCHDILEGSNDITGLGGYSAGKGWDACTGWGSPDGNQLLQKLSVTTTR